MRYLLALLVSISLVSCGKKHDFDHAFEQNCWQYSQSLNFQPKVQQANAKLQYELQFTDDYNFQNINLKMHLKSPSGKEKDTVIVDTLMNGLGVWRGEFSGGKHHVPFKHIYTLPLSETGTYQLNIQHAMRKDTLCGVAAIGINLIK